MKNLEKLLLDLIGIANRTKAGQVTHKIEEIKEYVRSEIIGKDEFIDPTLYDRSYEPIRNQLRAEQRKKI